MFRFARSLPALALGATLSLLLAADAARAYVPIATAVQVTNTKNGRNEMPAVDKRGKTIVFISNSDHVVGVSTPTTGAFDYDNSGTAFSSGVSPSPVCTNCTSIDDSNGNLYLWHLKKKGDVPANSVTQLTFSTAGGFDANEHPDMDPKAGWVVWNSADDHVGSNADGNSEIFLMDLDTTSITQVTDTAGGSGSANRTATVSDKGEFVAFASSRDFSGLVSCRRPDGVTACSNPDNNSEVMLYDREAATLTQVTDTVGDGNDAQAHPSISVDGNFIVFQSTRDFSGPLSGGVSCAGFGGGACSNDGNGEIVMYDIALRQLTQVTNTINQAGCNDKTSNERPEASKKAKYLVFQSECEDQLDAAGCGECNGNDEVFLVDMKRGTITQVTISDGGWNRVPRISDSGGYMTFDSNRSYFGLNAPHNEKLYVLKRSSTKQKPGFTAKVQVEEDAILEAGGTIQHPKAKLTTIQFDGGFPASDRIGMSGNGRFIVFESSKNVGNQEIFRLDRNKCTHGFPDCF